MLGVVEGGRICEHIIRMMGVARKHHTLFRNELPYYSRKLSISVCLILVSQMFNRLALLLPKSFTDKPLKNSLLYVGVLITLWIFLFPIFLFAAQPKEFFLDGLKKLEQRSHKCVELKGNM
jgi:hypothetical protein